MIEGACLNVRVVIAMLPCLFKARAHIQVHPQTLAPARGIAGQRTVLEFPNPRMILKRGRK